jgi:hypothetical protein
MSRSPWSPPTVGHPGAQDQAVIASSWLWNIASRDPAPVM